MATRIGRESVSVPFEGSAAIKVLGSTVGAG
jgi:hypothetical protein